MTTKTTVNDREIARFSAMADEWWDPTGKFRPLHKFSPVRLGYIKEHVSAHYGRNAEDPKAFKGLRCLDIGCGGGLLCEPMTRLGAELVGVDPSPVNIEVARLHAERSGLDIDYRATRAEDLAAAGERFDFVFSMEVVEHVADVPAYLSACAEMVKPGGLMFIATINRTLKAYALAIVAAERVLRWLPAGTHSYKKLVKPSEIEGPLQESGMTIIERCGVTYNPLFDRWGRSRDMDVNYMMLASRPK
ncbi:bifunctional 2-polyprenyl-6-hydroxyphenol methylase/3-demethylubiquinol 3-O-methyltransferase UbiG [Breoghania sp.]|uniref:bifunctional 2-polyprenyl-6-hydroxyphenol methylase/3-demethylubiquinol 3-O-methyltransferase UbiG n=1 Tax=Breoghania sp. TaxID=2065378 RepID=UPI0026387EA1|nr:bifunctional 2-polyprenyl-6-hydroxyphenol methylase/3-demethylubiquinol 3-O-methyltransferase UbiG [Breoghania sp.]MDJ0932544.1 bifunctional 2-polyprenyl-6-hydroxyphenol methylase/3-demethylubiquinol 3-O-methyltransferase UbiG [Breoghania sp.]